MTWEYWLERFGAKQDTEYTEEKLAELGGGGWEAVTSWTAPGINQGEPVVYILFKKPK
jgi:hypothetical protein